MVQGTEDEEARNRQPFPFDVKAIDAVVISHSHIDHSGRVPLLVKLGYSGPVYTHNASKALCEVMLPDSGYLNEKDAEWENKKHQNRGKARVLPLYTREVAEACIEQFRGLEYESPTEIIPGLTLTLFDAGHILDASIVQLEYHDKGSKRTLVFSGDLGYRDAPLMEPAHHLTHADAVLLAEQENIPEEDRAAVVDYVGAEFRGLHEGNTIRYKLKAEDLERIVQP